MKHKFSFILISILLMLFFIGMGRMWFHKQREYKRIIKILTSMDPLEIDSFRVYSRVTLRPSGIPINIDSHDSLIHDFFQSLTDIQAYNPPGRDTIASNEHCWFLEVTNKNEQIQIGFYIPTQIGGIFGYRKGGYLVVGEIIKSKSHSPYYGRFQSRQLYQWYQTYSHRWLMPEGSPPALSP